MLAPAAINIFYPSPSIVFLDFIEDLDKRFEVGMRLMHDLINFEHEFHLGLLRLLKDGGKNVEIEMRIERHGFKDVEVFQLNYSEIAQQYHIRAKILSLLRLSEEEIENKLEKVVEDMKLAGIPLLLVFSWNPLPLEIKAIFDTALDGKNRTEKIFHYINFPLSTIQCHQIIGLMIAKKNEYKIKEERWIARASRILDELKFEEEINNFIEKGIEDGYTVRPLQLENLRPKEVAKVLRSLLITEGSIENRYKQICELKDKFVIYGKDFPVCPKDIESKDQLERFTRDLIRNGFVEEMGTDIEIRTTNFEHRILALLKEFNGHIESDKVDKFFVTMSSEGFVFGTDIYLDVLLEKERIRYDKRKSAYFIKSIDDLRSEFESLKSKLSNFQKKLSDFPYGYLASIKQRDINAVILSDCIELLNLITKDLENLQFLPEQEERWIRKLKLFKLLFEQFNDIYGLVDEFSRNLSTKYAQARGTNLIKIKRSLKELEDRLNHSNLFEKIVRIKERKQVEEKEKLVKETENKNYSRDEIKSKAEEYLSVIREFEGLYNEFKKCPVFDVKIIELANEYIDLQNLVSECERKIRNIMKIEEGLWELKQDIDNHEIFKLKYNSEETPISAKLLEWVRHNIESFSKE